MVINVFAIGATLPCEPVSFSFEVSELVPEIEVRRGVAFLYVMWA
jgi:hypothetical protein